MNECSLVKRFLEWNTIERIQLDSFDHFLNVSLPTIMNRCVLFENKHIRVEVDTFNIDPPSVENYLIGDRQPVTPELCLQRCFSFVGPLHVRYKCTFTGEQSCETAINTTTTTHYFSLPLCVVPLMITSAHTNIVDLYGTFIVRGAKKIVNMEERIAYNSAFLLAKKKMFGFEPYLEFKSINRFYKSSLVDIGQKSGGIQVYCPELLQNDHLDLYIVLRAFFQSSSE